MITVNAKQTETMTILEVSHDEYDNWYEAATLMSECILSSLLAIDTTDPYTGQDAHTLFTEFIPFVGAIISLQPTVMKWRNAQENNNWVGNEKHLMQLDILMGDPSALKRCSFSPCALVWLRFESRALGYLEELMAISDLGVKIDEQLLKDNLNKDTCILLAKTSGLVDKVAEKLTCLYSRNYPDHDEPLEDICHRKYESWLSEVSTNTPYGDEMINNLPFGKAIHRMHGKPFVRRRYGLGFHKTLTRRFFKYMLEDQKTLMGWRLIKPFQITPNQSSVDQEFLLEFLNMTKCFHKKTKDPHGDFKSLMTSRLGELEALRDYLNAESTLSRKGPECSLCDQDILDDLIRTHLNYEALVNIKIIN